MTTTDDDEAFFTAAAAFHAELNDACTRDRTFNPHLTDDLRHIHNRMRVVRAAHRAGALPARLAVQCVQKAKDDLRVLLRSLV